MSDRPDIKFDVPAEYVTFVRAFGLKSPQSDSPIVFRLTKEGSLPYHHPQSDNETAPKPIFIEYTAPVKFFDGTAKAIFDATPAAPFGWHHVGLNHIEATTDSKRDVVSILRDFQVDKEKLKAFDRVKISQLEEIVDSSPTDEPSIEELLKRSKQTPPDTLVFGLTPEIVGARGIKQIRVVMHKQQHREKLQYTLSADFSQHWANRETGIKAAVEHAKFQVFLGSHT